MLQQHVLILEHRLVVLHEQGLDGDPVVVLRPFQMVSELLPETEVLNAADDTERLAKLSFTFDLENHSIIEVFRRVLFLIKMRSKEI